jgi:3-methylcrotonyl-CoA carboxylase beta subunit
MGGAQASSVLATVKRDQLARTGETWDPDDEAAFREQIRDSYERAGDPYHATARLWDDGIVDPVDTRRVLGLALSVCARTPLPEPAFGLFRM